MARQPILTTFAIVFLALPIPAQQKAAPVLTFDVASVKPDKTAPNSTRFRNVNGRLKVKSSLRSIILSAYGVDNQRLAGVPAWAIGENFDIDAVVQEDPAMEPRQARERNLLRLQALLEDRFKLRVHRETRMLPCFVLLVAGKDGSKLKSSRPDAPSTMSGGWSGHMRFRAQEMDTLADFLWAELERPVIDQTGLTGEYDFDLEFQPERRDPAPDPLKDLGKDGSRPSIFEAVQDQLGLKLEPRRMPVDLLLVDHVERPTAN